MPNRKRGAQRFPVMNNNLQLGYRGVMTLLIYINNEIYIAGTPVLYETNEQELPCVALRHYTSIMITKVYKIQHIQNKCKKTKLK